MTAPTQERIPTLGQRVALVGGAKKRAMAKVTDAYQACQKQDDFYGKTRVFTPKEDGGDTFPDEKLLLKSRSQDVIEQVQEALTGLFDLVAAQEWSNAQATADVVVDGRVLIAKAPVTYLMWLEKELHHLHTFVSKLPVLSVGDKWEYDSNAQCFRTEPEETVKSKKVMKNHVKAPATDRHPAQVEVFHEDVPMGTWKTTKLSSALPAEVVAEMLGRVDRLIDAVRIAHEECNMTAAANRNVGEDLLTYVFAGS